MHDQRKRGDHCEERSERSGKSIYRILTGASSAIGKGIGNLHGFDAVDAQNRFNQKKTENQPEAAENAFCQQKDIGRGPIQESG